MQQLGFARLGHLHFALNDGHTRAFGPPVYGEDGAFHRHQAIRRGYIEPAAALLGCLHDHASALQANSGAAEPAGERKLGALTHLDQRTIGQPHHGDRTARRANLFTLAKLHPGSESNPAGVRHAVERTRYTLDHAAWPARRGEQSVAHLPGAHPDAHGQRGGYCPFPLRSKDSLRDRLEAHHVTRLRGFERASARRAAMNMVFHQPRLRIRKLFRTISGNQSPEIGARAQYVIATAHGLGYRLRRLGQVGPDARGGLLHSSLVHLFGADLGNGLI